MANGLWLSCRAHALDAKGACVNSCYLVKELHMGNFTSVHNCCQLEEVGSAILNSYTLLD